MKEALKEHSEKGFTVLGLGFQDSEANIRKYAAEHSMPWPVSYDTGDLVAKLLEKKVLYKKDIVEILGERHEA